MRPVWAFVFLALAGQNVGGGLHMEIIQRACIGLVVPVLRRINSAVWYLYGVMNEDGIVISRSRFHQP